MRSDQKIFRKMTVILLCIVIISLMCPVCVMAAGDTVETATSVTFDKQIKGSLSEDNFVDFYKIVLSESGKLSIKTSAQIDRFNYGLYYGENGANEVSSGYLNWDSVSHYSNNTYSWCLSAGTYFFEIKRGTGWLNGEDVTGCGSYNLIFSFAKSNETIAENYNNPNNSMDTATSVSINTKYRGYLADNDTRDFYKFVLPAGDTVNILCTFYEEGINLYLYDSEGQQLETKTVGWDSNSQMGSYTITKTLEKGTYYFVVTDRSYHDSWGAFDFTIKAENIKPLSITTQPKNYTGAVGSTASFTVAAQGTGLSYQWQMYTDGAWKNSNASSAKTAKLTFKVNENHNGMKYRCIVKDASGQKAYTNTVFVNVSSSVTITKQPANVTGAVGDTATFSVTAQGTGLQYQWQMYSNGAWKNSGATGAKTNKITFKIAQSHNGVKYRCIITNSNGQKFYSNTATVKVIPAFAITKQPVSITCSAGKMASFSVTATGEGLTYQWQVYSNGAWRNSGATGATTNKIAFNATKNHNGMKYRCVVKDKNGKKILSNTATITVK
ncbi:MAG: pre-peptidase C-terminal domain-containing protein [Clostridiales bacterium]|nr:pre-peptidase C-terminal domain-containing protein [Clostridiales bacterium]